MSTVSAVGTRWLTADEQGAWRVFLNSNALVNAATNRALSRDSGLSGADFAVLVYLSEHPDKQLRVLELANALQWEKSRVSHQLRRMGERGLIDRVQCGADRRGSYARISKAGLRAIEDAAPRHVELVRAIFVDPLTEQDIADLTRILGKVITAVEGRPEVAPDAGCDG